MYRTLTYALTLVLATGLLSIGPLSAHAQDTSAYAQDKGEKQEMADRGDIVETAKSSDDFKTLVTALQSAELVSALQGEGPFTVFAPTNEAFDALPEGTLDNLLKPENKAELQSILKFHVVEGKVKASDVTKMEKATTLEGSSVGIAVEEGTVTLSGKNNARVTKTDIMASNGVIHVIDQVLMPPERTAMKEGEQ